MTQITSFKYINPFTILVINPAGKLRHLYTPFRVKCIDNDFVIPINTWLFVDGISQDPKHRITYLIGGKHYPYRHFAVIIGY